MCCQVRIALGRALEGRLLWVGPSACCIGAKELVMQLALPNEVHENAIESCACGDRYVRESHLVIQPWALALVGVNRSATVSGCPWREPGVGKTRQFAGVVLVEVDGKEHGE